MKPTNLELRQLRINDERLSRFKEYNFTSLGLDEPVGMFVLCVFLSIPGMQIFILLALLLEWYLKLFRMAKIVFNQLILIAMRFNYGKLIAVIVFALVVLFILANALK